MYEKIELTDTAIEAAMKIGEGNPGAISVCAQIIKRVDDIDPDSATSWLGPFCQMGEAGIVGSRVWMLYKVVCGEDLVKTLAVLRGRQLGFVSEAELNHAIDNRGDGLYVEQILESVQAELPAFGVES